ncbi:cytochrome P450 CYP3/CYP5/CYP6/CYP9 subfamilies [Moesziomyces antarcticus T-34]|uniref:Cytochrome P450 CYP3/CYP5/CYP6/CYP9 subfamilies n=1 Tax=Pseudozyma antarctica (strain T-34) TaxID=1151754 RepID=M9M5G3_PSEA3|nr:cytochrome P450 CYP3/CYP5/CYP6/CYP9 subfamilies [Moesziomyces antarcticus T-34]
MKARLSTETLSPLWAQLEIALSLIRHRPVWSSLALAVLIPLVLALAVAMLMFGTAFYRYVKLDVLRIDPYSHFPTPGKTDRWRFVTGNLGFIRRHPPSEGHLEFARRLKTKVYTYRGIFYSPLVFIADPRAMLHIFSAANSYNFEKPYITRLVLRNFLGEGVLVVEGDIHKRQRKIIQPAFSVGAIRELNPIFMRYSRDLADKIGDMIDRSASATPGKKGEGADGINSPFVAQPPKSLEVSKPGAPVLDVSWWTTRAALDIIGDAGFGYHFDSLKIDVDPSVVEERAGDVLGNAFNTLFKLTLSVNLTRFLQLYLSRYPLLRWIERIPNERKRMTQDAYAKLEDVSMQIVERKKRQIRGEMAAELAARGTATSGLTKADFDEKAGDGVGVAPGMDLLHLMMRANMAADVNTKEKLDDKELIGQITTLLIAGHETTSNQTAWTLWLLAGTPELQQKLRDEIHEHFGRDMDHEIGYDELMGMEYLDAVCKESFRVKSAVPSTVRVSKADCDIPLSRPYPSRDGKATTTSIHIPKGRDIFIPIQAINVDTDIWGPDAADFVPERWINLRDEAKHNGLPMHLMTFISGPRGCIGNRFALAEFKAMLCHLVGRFQFDQVDGWQVEAKQTAVIRSRVVGQEDYGPQMPLRVSRIASPAP